MEMCKTLLGFAHFHRHRRHEPKQHISTGTAVMNQNNKTGHFTCYKNRTFLFATDRRNNRTSQGA